MRVGVEHPVQIELLAVGIDDELRDGLRVGPLLPQPLEVGDLHAFEVLHHQHPPRAVLPDDARDDHVAPLDRRPASAAAILAELRRPSSGSRVEVAGNDLGVVALVDEVQLQWHVQRDLLDQRAEVEVALEPGEDAEEEADVAQVVLDDALDARVLHLDRHLAAVVEAGVVNLRQRGGRDRLLFELREDVGERAAFHEGLPLDAALDDGERPRRHAVLEAREHRDVLVGDEVGTGADDLAELDEQPLAPDGQVVETAGRVRMVARPPLVGVLEAEALLGEGDRLVAEVDAGGQRGGRKEAGGAVGQAHGCTSM